MSSPWRLLHVQWLWTNSGPWPHVYCRITDQTLMITMLLSICVYHQMVDFTDLYTCLNSRSFNTDSRFTTLDLRLLIYDSWLMTPDLWLPIDDSESITLDLWLPIHDSRSKTPDLWIPIYDSRIMTSLDCGHHRCMLLHPLYNLQC